MDPIPLDLESQYRITQSLNNSTIANHNRLRFECPQNLSKELHMVQDIVDADEMNETCFDKYDDASLGMLASHTGEKIANIEVL